MTVAMTQQKKNRRASFEDQWLFMEEGSQDSFFSWLFDYDTESVTQFRGSSKPFDSRAL